LALHPSVNWNRAATMSKRYLICLSDASATCGVEEFARQLALRLGARCTTSVLGKDGAGLSRHLGDVDGVVLNFPIVAWKTKLVWPSRVALAARRRRKDVIVVLHEWQALDWKRRIVLAPVVALATRLVFSAPEIAAEFGRSPLSLSATPDRQVVPVPPNLLPPPELQATAMSARLVAERAGGRIILGQFGSIYPKKQSTAVLDVARTLIARGHDVFVVFIGSFIKGLDDVEQDFQRHVERSGLTDRVLVTGYVGDDRELFGLFEPVDVFCYLFPEGLTSRRASVLAAALFGRPVVVNAPVAEDALAHHGLYRALIGGQAIRLVPTGADVDTVADAVLEAVASPPGRMDVEAEVGAIWRTVQETICP
jgi:glycosyltransferase involved in cell wall biosynthesis